MIRILLAALGVLLGAEAASAQIIAGASVGSGSFGGGFRQPAPSMMFMPQRHRAALYFNRPLAGYFPLYPYYGAGYGYGFGGGFYYNPFYSYYPSQPSYTYDAPQPLPAPQPVPPARVVELSGELTASLTLEFPAPAKLWVNGTQLEGEAEAIRTLTSPALKPGERYTFKVRAQWTTNGRTYETTRDVALGPGDRSKLLVVSGAAVSEK